MPLMKMEISIGLGQFKKEVFFQTMDKELFKEHSKIYKITVFEDLCLKKSLVLNDFFLVLKEPQIYI